MNPPPTLTDLPDEVVRLISSNLPLSSQSALAMTSRATRGAIQPALDAIGAYRRELGSVFGNIEAATFLNRAVMGPATALTNSKTLAIPQGVSQGAAADFLRNLSKSLASVSLEGPWGFARGSLEAQARSLDALKELGGYGAARTLDLSQQFGVAQILKGPVVTTGARGTDTRNALAALERAQTLTSPSTVLRPAVANPPLANPPMPRSFQYFR